MKKTALIVVDAQEDFIDSCPHSDHILKNIGHLSERADLVIATQSVHPPEHLSFMELGLHCVKGSKGARLNPEIKEDADYIPTKGDDPSHDDYSAFSARTLRPLEPIEKILRVHKIEEVGIVGFGHRWDIPSSAYDSNALGYTTRVWLAASRPFDEKTLVNLKRAGVIVRYDIP